MYVWVSICIQCKLTCMANTVDGYFMKAKSFNDNVTEKNDPFVRSLKCIVRIAHNSISIPSYDVNTYRYIFRRRRRRPAYFRRDC